MQRLKSPEGFYVPAQFIELAEQAKFADQIQLQRINKWPDRKSTRLNSSHGYISYAVFCLKKKKQKKKEKEKEKKNKKKKNNRSVDSVG